jgi:hypothetical protein
MKTGAVADQHGKGRQKPKTGQYRQVLAARWATAGAALSARMGSTGIVQLDRRIAGASARIS